MHPWMTSIQAEAPDACEHTLDPARALAFVNAYAGAAAVPALSHACAERKQAYAITPLLPTSGGDTCSDSRTRHVLPSPEKSYHNLDSPPQGMCSAKCRWPR